MLRSALHCAREWKAVRSSSLPSRKPVTTPGQRLTHVRSKGGGTRCGQRRRQQHGEWYFEWRLRVDIVEKVPFRPEFYFRPFS